MAAATLSLLAAAAERAPVMAIIDDAHWLDRPSREALLFAARRVRREGIVLLLGMRERDWAHTAGVDELGLLGLSSDDGAALVDRIGVPVTAIVREQVVRQAGGNPLAILETVSELTAAERTGTVPIAGALADGAGLERAFAQRLGRLPAETCRALLIAATSETGDVDEITRALAAVGMDVAALAPAQRDGVIVIAEAHVSFRHPLVRSAAYHLDRGFAAKRGASCSRGRDPRRSRRAGRVAPGGGDHGARMSGLRRCSRTRLRPRWRERRTRLRRAPTRQRHRFTCRWS